MNPKEFVSATLNRKWSTDGSYALGGGLLMAAIRHALMGVCFFPISLTVISRYNVAFSISLTDFPVQCRFLDLSHRFPGTMSFSLTFSISRYNVSSPVQCHFPGTMSLSRHNVTFSQVERLDIRYLMQISHAGPVEDTAAILQL